MGFVASLKRSLRLTVARWLLPPAAEPTPPAPQEVRGQRISRASLAELQASGVRDVWHTPEPPPWVARMAATDRVALAMDSLPLGDMGDWAADSSAFSEGLGFLGYAYLAELTQRPEYRKITEIWAAECTRKWVKLTGKDPARVAKLEDEMVRFGVREKFREALEVDGFFGRSHIFMEVDGVADLSQPLTLEPETFKVDSLVNLKVVEPFWIYPQTFDTQSPLADSFYAPEQWLTMQGSVHFSRLLTFVGREVPDILKPVYLFGGLSLSQIAKPYVDNFIRNRTSVSNLIYSFSTMVLSTEMSAMLAPGGSSDLVRRIQAFTLGRDNNGLFLVDKETEELTNVSAPLSTLDALLAQSQEFTASVVGIPLVVLLGVTPKGLNASSDGELKAFYGHIKGFQERAMQAQLNLVLRALQLNLDGTLDETLEAQLVDLWELDETAKVANRKAQADIDGGLIDRGVVSNEEVRDRLEKEEDGPYFGVTLQGNDEMQEASAGMGDYADQGDNDNDATPEDLKRAANDAFVAIAPFLGAMDKGGEHWITVHPNGPDTKGTPLLISSGEGGYTVIGGAGGKLNGHVVTPKTMSGKRGGSSAPKGDLHGTSHPDAAVSHVRGERERLTKLEEARKTHQTDKDRAGATYSGSEYQKQANALGFHPLTEKEIQARHAELDSQEKGHHERIASGGDLYDKNAGNVVRKPTAAEIAHSQEHLGAGKPAGPPEHERRTDETMGEHAHRLSAIAHREGRAEAHRRAQAAHKLASANTILDTRENINNANGHENMAKTHAGRAVELETAAQGRGAGEGVSEFANRKGEEAYAAGTPEGHLEAAGFHQGAREHAMANNEYSTAGRHAGEVRAHTAQARTAVEGPLWATRRATEASAAANGLKPKRNDRAGLEAAGRAHRDAYEAHTEAGMEAKRHRNLELSYEHQAMAREHSMASGKIRTKLDNLAKLEKVQAKEAQFRASAGEEGTAEHEGLSNRYLGKGAPSAEAIHQQWTEKWGLGLHNETGARAKYARAQGKFARERHRLSSEEYDRRYAELTKLGQQAASELHVENHSAADIDDRKNKEHRAMLGHIEGALEHIASQGYDIAGALKEANVHYAPAGTGTAFGHAVQVGRKGFFSLSPTTNSPAFRQVQAENHKTRMAKEGAVPWNMSTSAPAHQMARATTIHELAHALGMQSHINSPGRLNDIMQKLYPDPTERHKWIHHNISEYATENGKERDAELAAKVTRADYVPGSLPKELEDHVKWLFNPKGVTKP